MAKRPTRAPIQHPSEPATVQPMRVRAIKLGYYNDERKREGDVFTLNDPQDFTKKWMEEVAPSTPERKSSSKDALRVEHQRMRAEKAVNGFVAPPDDPDDGLDPIGAGR